MSDFFSNGWSFYIAAATILGLVACLALLIIASKTKIAAVRADEVADGSTGHVWDEDLRELNNPLPRRWSRRPPRLPERQRFWSCSQ